MAGEWFFSTLAQVSAAVVGFIIAITMVTYSLEKERKMNRTAEFRDVLEEFYQSYNSAFDRLQAHLSRSDVNQVNEYVFNNYGAENIREDMFTSEYQKHPVPVQIYCLSLHIATTVSSDLRPGKPNIPSIETIESVGEAAIEIQELLEKEESSRLIYSAITGLDDMPEDYMRKPVFNPPINLNGEDIRSLEEFSDLCGEMASDYFKILDRAPAVYSDYSSGAYDVLNISVYLIIFSIFSPLIMVMSPPDIISYNLSRAAVFSIQILLLGGSSILTFVLIDLVRVSLQSERGSSVEPRRITKKFIHHLPRVI